MMFLGVIPARGGSKGIPRKNITELAGRPLLAYTVETARKAEELDDFVVSTDDEEIKAVARDLGAPVLDRPDELATDTARTEPVLLHAADHQDEPPDAIVTLEPTSPLRTAELVDRCIREHQQSDGDAVMTVKENGAIVGTLEAGRFHPVREDQPRRRQDREPFYEETSTVYVTDLGALRETGGVHGTDAIAVVVEEHQAVDIDDPIDLALAEVLVEDAPKEALR